MNQYLNVEWSRCASVGKFVRRASPQARLDTVQARLRSNTCFDKPDTRQVTAPGIRSAAGSKTTGSTVSGVATGRSTQPPDEGSRSPARPDGSASARPVVRLTQTLSPTATLQR